MKAVRLSAESSLNEREVYLKAKAILWVDEIDFVHTYVKMPGLLVKDEHGVELGRLCKAALGDSFAGGTTDGPGMFDFTQAQTSNKFFEFMVSFVHKSTEEEKECQHPKGIFLPTGSVDFPWPWAQEVIPLQLLRIGGLFLAVVPTELTTMAGRRLRASIKRKLIKEKVATEQSVIVIAGLSNSYTDYTTTFEEYQEQRYEGGSTIYGPHQLSAYMQEFNKLIENFAFRKEKVNLETPEDFSDRLIDTGERLHNDHLPRGVSHFGQVMQSSKTLYRSGERVVVTFAGGNPNNDLRHQSTFMEVQKCIDERCSKVQTIAVDDDWETRIEIIKKRRNLIERTTTWRIIWTIPNDVEAGLYRITHNGTAYHEDIFGNKRFIKYEGVSPLFKVIAKHQFANWE